MKIKDYIILFIVSLCLGYVLANTNNTNNTVPVIPYDTVSIDTISCDTEVNVSDKVALFIGDSHTANNDYGWQVQLCNATGLKMINASVGGKTTKWMLDQAVYRINKHIDYCFIYGGANDMYCNIPIKDAIDNIKDIARICKGNNVVCIILTGFDPIKCTRTYNKSYATNYTKYQEALLSENIDGAVIVDTRIIDRMDCRDRLCHMKLSGHTKIANILIHDLKFKKVSK